MSGRRRARRATPEAPSGGEALSEALAREAPARPEAWTRAALVVFALFALALAYLGLRPGGVGPLVIYMEGRLALALLALAILAWGVVVAFRRRPLLQPGRARALFALALVIGVANYPFPYPSSHEHHPSAVQFRLPVEGEWVVVWGGDRKATNRLAAFLPDRRWGLHLVVEREGATGEGAGIEASDYHAFGREVLAPAAGRVVAVHDGEPDHPPRRRGGGAPLGNHLVLEVAPSEFCFLTNLQQGSILVAVGDELAPGDALARVGSSGSMVMTPQPHVALHLQDTSVPLRGEAVPWTFSEYASDGRRVERGQPAGGLGAAGELQGDRVRHLGAE